MKKLLAAIPLATLLTACQAPIEIDQQYRVDTKGCDFQVVDSRVDKELMPRGAIHYQPDYDIAIALRNSICQSSSYSHRQTLYLLDIKCHLGNSGGPETVIRASIEDSGTPIMARYQSDSSFVTTACSDGLNHVIEDITDQLQQSTK